MLEHLDELVEKFIHTKSESLAKLAAREEQLKGNYDQSIVKLDQQLRHYIKVLHTIIHILSLIIYVYILNEYMIIGQNENKN